eukprot:22549-Chlamydomonas_euryale.AAC.1
MNVVHVRTDWTIPEDGQLHDGGCKPACAQRDRVQGPGPRFRFNEGPRIGLAHRGNRVALTPETQNPRVDSVPVKCNRASAYRQAPESSLQQSTLQP